MVKTLLKEPLKRHLIQTKSFHKLSSFLVLECYLQFRENFLYGVLLRNLFVTK